MPREESGFRVNGAEGFLSFSVIYRRSQVYRTPAPSTVALFTSTWVLASTFSIIFTIIQHNTYFCAARAITTDSSFLLVEKKMRGSGKWVTVACLMPVAIPTLSRG
jgi:hypothetical protein